MGRKSKKEETHVYMWLIQWLPGGKESAHNVGHPGLISGLGGFPGEGNGNPLQWRIPWTEEPGGL